MLVSSCASHFYFGQRFREAGSSPDSHTVCDRRTGVATTTSWTLAPPVLTVTVASPEATPVYASDDLKRFYPQRAARMGVNGGVDLRCQGAAGRLTRCDVIREVPANYEFGAAARELLIGVAPVTWQSNVNAVPVSITFKSGEADADIVHVYHSPCH